MNRLWTIVILACGLLGCASHSKPQVTVIPQYEDAPAGSLVFAPPIGPDEPLPQLAREPRQPAAFVGWDDLSITTYQTYTDDFFWGESRLNNGFYVRRSMVEKAGVRYR